MKKIALLGLLVALGTGCGRGWLPLYRGAPCQTGCGIASAPADGCAGCGTTAAAYGTYGSDALSGYYGGETVVNDNYTGSGTIIDNGIINSPMSAVPAS